MPPRNLTHAQASNHAMDRTGTNAPPVGPRRTLAAALTLAAVIALAGGAALARDGDPPAVAREDTGPAGGAMARAMASYRLGPWAERVTLRFMRGGGPDARPATIDIFADRGDLAEGRPPRLRLDLGRLLIAIEGSRLIAVHKQNADLYAEHDLGSAPMPEALAMVLPPIPVPQIAWTHWGASADADAALAAVEAVTPLRGLLILPEVRRLGGVLEIDAEDDGPHQFGLALDPASARVSEFWLGYPGDRGVALVQGTVEPLPISPPASWGIDVAGRQRVGSIAMLRPATPRLSAGEPLPALGLLTPELDAVDREADVTRVRTMEAERRRGTALPTLEVLVLYDAQPDAQSDASAQADIEAGVAAVQAVRPFAGEPARGRWSPGPRVERLVPVFEPGGVSRVALAAHIARWNAWSERAGSSAPPVSASPAGRRVLQRILPGARGMIVVVGEGESLVGIVPLDGRSGEPGGIARDLRAVLNGVWGEPTR